MATALTELGPYGVPVSITLPLFGAGVPLRFTLATGLLNLMIVGSGYVVLQETVTGKFILVHSDRLYLLEQVIAKGQVYFVDDETGKVVLQAVHSSLQNRNKLLSNHIVLVDFDTAQLDQTEQAFVDSPLVVESEGIINLIETDVG